MADLWELGAVDLTGAAAADEAGYSSNTGNNVAPGQTLVDCLLTQFEQITINFHYTARLISPVPCAVIK